MITSMLPYLVSVVMLASPKTQGLNDLQREFVQLIVDANKCVLLESGCPRLSEMLSKLKKNQVSITDILKTAPDNDAKKAFQAEFENWCLVARQLETYAERNKSTSANDVLESSDGTGSKTGLQSSLKFAADALEKKDFEALKNFISPDFDSNVGQNRDQFLEMLKSSAESGYLDKGSLVFNLDDATLEGDKAKVPVEVKGAFGTAEQIWDLEKKKDDWKLKSIADK